MLLEELESLQAEYFADDCPIDVERMALLTEAEARQFFESGGDKQPDETPAASAGAPTGELPVSHAADWRERLGKVPWT